MSVSGASPRQQIDNDFQDQAATEIGKSGTASAELRALADKVEVVEKAGAQIIDGVKNLIGGIASLFGIGGVNPPPKPDTTKPTPGYSNNGGTDSTLGSEPSGQVGQINWGAGIEEIVMQLMIKLQAKSEERVKTSAKSMDAKTNEKGAKGEAAGVPKEMEVEFNKATNELKQMNDLVNNMTKLFKDMKDSVIQNIGR